jgi:hypothetical protein
VCNTNFSQAIDLDSHRVYEVVSQQLYAPSTSKYLLHIEWLPPDTNPVGKSFKVSIDSVTVGSVTCTDANYINHYYEVLAHMSAGAPNHQARL